MCRHTSARASTSHRMSFSARCGSGGQLPGPSSEVGASCRQYQATVTGGERSKGTRAKFGSGACLLSLGPGLLKPHFAAHGKLATRGLTFCDAHIPSLCSCLDLKKIFLKIRALLLWVRYLNESLSLHRSAANKTDTSRYWKERILPLFTEE